MLKSADPVLLRARFCQLFSSPPPPPRLCWFFSTDVFQCDGCLFLSFPVGAHGWVALLCQSWGHYFNLGGGGGGGGGGVAANSGSLWMLKALNLHSSDAVVKEVITQLYFPD